MKNITLISLTTAALLTTTLSASSNSVASITLDPNSNNAQQMPNDSEPQVLNPANTRVKLVAKKLYTNQDIETSMNSVRDAAFTLYNLAVDMEVKKANPIKGDLQNFNIGADNDIRDLMKKVNNILSTDKSLLSEKDTIALAALKKAKKDLKDKLDALDKKVPIGNTGYKLPTTAISVMGSSAIQAYPLKVDGKMIGHFRVVCGGNLREDLIVNNKSVSYCIASMKGNGVTRISDDHVKRTTSVYYTAVSDPYIVGEQNMVNLNWMTHPKTDVVGLMKHYNVDKIPNAVETLRYNSTITMSDGTVLAGTNATVTK